MAGRFEGPVGMQEPHPDADIVVYHTTTPEHAALLKQYGTTQPKPTGAHAELRRQLAESGTDLSGGAPGAGRSSGLYVTRHPGEGFMYGTHSLPVRIKMRDLGVSAEMAGHSPWRALNQSEGYIPHMLQPHQFGDIYTAADHRDWDNQHG